MRATLLPLSRRLLSALVVAAALLTHAPPAAAAADFTFYGGGWGHGVGMSQYGAYGLALDGWGTGKILRHYYAGVKLERRDPPRPRYRVGLLQHRDHVTVSVAAGKLRITVGKRRLETFGTGSRTILVRKDRFRILRPGGVLVGGRSWPARKPLRVHRVNGGVAQVAEWGHALGRGVLELRRASPGSAHVVARLRPEEYLYGVAEVPSSWPKAVLKAQAIAARTFAARRVASGRSGCGCHLVADTRDQAYVGWDKEAGTAGARWVAAVDATAGRLVTYQGQPASTLYSSSSGGYTENVENIWGGSPAPYLKGTCDPGDYTAANPNRTWVVTLSGAQAAAKLRSALGWNVGTVTSFEAKQRGVSGRVVTMRILGTKPGGGSFSATASGWALRGALGLRDTRFWVNQDLLVTGRIRNAYDALRCAPGLPTGADQAVAGGRWQSFKEGRMYENGALGLAFWLHGRVLEHYLVAGGPGGTLGLPTSGITTHPDGSESATFKGGSVTCPPAGACS